MSEWRDIETAPKDGTVVLICKPGMKTPWMAKWETMMRVPDRWSGIGLGAAPFQPTLWMPLPKPPETDQ